MLYLSKYVQQPFFENSLIHLIDVIVWMIWNVWFHQHQEQLLIDTVESKEIYNTIRRKTKDAFYKNIVKKGYVLFNKGISNISVWFYIEAIMKSFH